MVANCLWNQGTTGAIKSAFLRKEGQRSYWYTFLISLSEIPWEAVPARSVQLILQS